MQKTAISRRRLLQASLAAPVLLPWSPAFGAGPRPIESCDTVVIGAGLAGLSAAITLENSGQTVRLVEADQRLGGRCYTMDTGDGSFDCGATTIGPLYGRIRAFAGQAGVELVPPHGRDPFSYNLEGTFIRREEWEQSPLNRLPARERALRPETLEFALVQAANRIEDIYRWRSEENLAYDIPLDDFLRNEGASEEAIRLMNMTSNDTGMGATSALFQMREFSRLALPQRDGANREVYAAADNGQYHYVKGGTSRLIEGMAGMLKGEPSVGDPVVAIDVQEDAVLVVLRSGRRIRGEAAICAVPYSALRNISVTPAFSGLKKAAVEQSAYTSTTHVFCVPESPYWEADDTTAGLLTDTLIERVFANLGDGGEVTWLDVWVNGRGALELDRYPEADRLRLVEQRLAELRPSTKGKVRAVATYSWGQNPFVQGNKQVMAPGQLRSIYPAMAQPWHTRLRFAGEHTRDYEVGMEAAAATGIREAMAVLQLASV